VRAEALFDARATDTDGPSLARWLAALLVIVLLAVFALGQRSEA
jgi:hypothetical protein